MFKANCFAFMPMRFAYITIYKSSYDLYFDMSSMSAVLHAESLKLTGCPQTQKGNKKRSNKQLVADQESRISDPSTASGGGYRGFPVRNDEE